MSAMPHPTLHPARQRVIAESIEQWPAGGDAIDTGSSPANHAGHLLPARLEKRRRHDHANSDGRIKREPFAKTHIYIAATVIERWHVDAGHRHRGVGHAATGRLGALTSCGEIQRFP